MKIPAGHEPEKIYPEIIAKRQPLALAATVQDHLSVRWRRPGELPDASIDKATENGDVVNIMHRLPGKTH